VLSFAALVALAGIFNTFRWSLNAPGYVMRQSMVNAQSVANQLLLQPDYIVLRSVTPGNVAAVDSQLEAFLGGNLFAAGFNFTRLPDVRYRHAKVVALICNTNLAQR
jgi:hypothetical protein